MADALTWGIAAGVAAEEGIKFLYGQMAELLKRARQRRDAAAPAAPGGQQDLIVATPPPGAFDEAPAQLRLPVERIAGHEHELDILVRAVAAHLARPRQENSGDAASLRAIGDLRALAESVSGQRLRLVGSPGTELEFAL